nr:tetraspanin-10 [Vulpes vulpes]
MVVTKSCPDELMEQTLDLPGRGPHWGPAVAATRLGWHQRPGLVLLLPFGVWAGGNPPVLQVPSEEDSRQRGPGVQAARCWSAGLAWKPCPRPQPWAAPPRAAVLYSPHLVQPARPGAAGGPAQGQPGPLPAAPRAPRAQPYVQLGAQSGAGCRALPGSSPLTSRRPGPAPREDQVWRAGAGGEPASPLPLGSSCLKYLTFLFNFVFSLLGLLALAVGLWGLAVKGPLGSGGAALPRDPMLGLALGGLAVGAVSLAGCLGALCENACLLHCFSGGLLAFLLLEAVLGALLVALWGPLQDGLEYTLRAAVAHYQDDPDLHFLIDQVQRGLQCCGASSYQDWTRNMHFNCSSPGAQACSLPASCCIGPREDGAAVSDPCGLGALGLDQEAAQRVVHLQGCGPPLRGWLRRSVRAAGVYVVAVVAVQGAELLLAAQLLRALAVRKGGLQSPRTAGTGAPRERPPA